MMLLPSSHRPVGANTTSDVSQLLPQSAGPTGAQGRCTHAHAPARHQHPCNFSLPYGPLALNSLRLIMRYGGSSPYLMSSYSHCTLCSYPVPPRVPHVDIGSFIIARNKVTRNQVLTVPCQQSLVSKDNGMVQHSDNGTQYARHAHLRNKQKLRHALIRVLKSRTCAVAVGTVAHSPCSSLRQKPTDRDCAVLGLMRLGSPPSRTLILR
ncbi:hypothetical protein J6590_075333 [Homalodisca vitripennis]|nr:hypothetical protein J6590_075333 [Homalodisca vitripennis]